MTSTKHLRSASSRVQQTERLAVRGGTPVRPPERRWPTWPIPAEDAAPLLQSVLESGRWAITSPAGTELFERRFAKMFAEYTGAQHCVPVDHGSSALVVAIESLRLEHGDVVLIPALTWVACASAVIRAGLVPVLVDVDPRTGCVGPEHLDLEVGAKAMLAVHWACAMADVPTLLETCSPHGIAIVEDAAQAHGAEWLGRPAGTMGRLGCFSMQHSKVLTGGEGGAVITNDDELAACLQELRADSRRYATSAAVPQELELEESATMMGANYCMSEFNAAVLCAQLPALDAQHKVRNDNYAVLANLIEDIPSVRLLDRPADHTRMSIYEAALVFEQLPEGMSNADVADALRCELHTRFYPPREPLNRSRLLQPWTKPTLAPLTERFIAEHRGRTYPNAEYLASHAVLTHHSTFLGDEQDMQDIAEAIGKLMRSFS